MQRFDTPKREEKTRNTLGKFVCVPCGREGRSQDSCILWAFILSLSRKRCTAKCAKRAVRENTMILWFQSQQWCTHKEDPVAHCFEWQSFYSREKLLGHTVPTKSSTSEHPPISTRRSHSARASRHNLQVRRLKGGLPPLFLFFSFFNFFIFSLFDFLRFFCVF